MISVFLVNGCSLNRQPLLPPATKLGQGNIFRSVCQEFCSQGVSRPTPRGGRLKGLAGGGVSRPTLRVEVGGSG